MYDRLVQPRWEGEDAPDYFTSEEYAGGYDDVTVEKPADTAYWNATLYYQTASEEYVEFLRDEINGTAGQTTLPPEAYIAQTDTFFSNLKGWGNALWDLWLHNGGAAPVELTTVGALMGDVNNDGVVDASDLSDLSAAYGSDPSKPNWNPSCDFNADSQIYVSDLFDLSKNYGKDR